MRALAVRQARRYLDTDAAEDAAQEALLRAWRSASRCQGRPEPWVQTIARHEALRIASRRGEAVLPEDPIIGTADQTSPVELRIDLARWMRCLTAHERQALFLSCWAGKSHAEIAALLGTPIGTIKIRIHRAHRKLLRAAGSPKQTPASR